MLSFGELSKINKKCNLENILLLKNLFLLKAEFSPIYLERKIICASQKNLKDLATKY